MDERICGILRSNGAEDASFSNIKLYKNENKLEATVITAVCLTHEQVKGISDGLSNMVGDCTVELKIEQKDIFSVADTDPDALAGILKKQWAQHDPMLIPALKNAVFHFESGDIEVRVPTTLEGTLITGDHCISFAKKLSELYRFEGEIRLVGDEALVIEKTETKKDEPVQKTSASAKKENDSAQKRRIKVLKGKKINEKKIMRQCDVSEITSTVTVSGELLSINVTERKNGGGSIVSGTLSDYTNTLPFKLFLDGDSKELVDKLTDIQKKRDCLILAGRYTMDDWMKRMCIFPYDVCSYKRSVREDKAEEKRVELHLHTQMSSMDALVPPSDAVETAARWGHRAVAITDHGVVQAFPAAVNAANKLKKKGTDIKVIMGVEGYLMPDCTPVDAYGEFCAIRTVSCHAVKTDSLFEISAVRFGKDKQERFSTLVDTGAIIPESLTKRYLITQQMLTDSGAPVKRAIEQLESFCEGAAKVFFDKSELKLLSDYAALYGLYMNTHCISLNMLAHYLHRELLQDDIESVLSALGIDTECSSDGRADSVKEMFLNLREAAGTDELPVIDAAPKEKEKGRRSTYHIILLAKNHEGLMNLYRLVSYAHLDHLKSVPRIPKSLLMMHRKGIIIGSACEAGEVFRAVLEGADEQKLKRIASMYDYLEIQPAGNNEFLLRSDAVEEYSGLLELNRRIVELGDSLGKPVVATGDVHFLNPEDSVFRSVLMHARAFKDAEQQAPLYFKTTDEMLEEFSYLGEEKAFEVVVRNPNDIADMCESMPPFLSEKRTYAPTFDGANDELRDRAMKRAHELYGEDLPQIVQKRLDKELGSIIGNGYASLYLMAQRLVNKSMSDGYLVGSRGSVGSSFVANMAGITEVNALPPHYVCPKCAHSDFDIDRQKYSCGVDMPDAYCPVCGEKYIKLGYDIPFEVFLGFKGDKTPDIDLNFSGEYQPVAHKFVEEMFGTGHAFRAGTISAIEDKTVFGYVKKYCEENGIHAQKEELDRLISGCRGVKRTTGQHPGGIVIVPKDRDIMEFTPIQYPADKSEKNIITTHFDFHALDDRLVKLDILGHDDPTALRMLKDITRLDPQNVPLDDKKTMQLFSGIEPLGISLDDIDCDVGSIAIPEFGTPFVRQMLDDTRPTTMEELVRISGLSHGTDVWLGNAQDIIRDGIANLNQVICARDDIMSYLIMRGMEPSLSFKIMESVRKGKGLAPEMESAMVSANIPEWFIGSCKKIKYMFPRAHAAAYVMMAFRIAYYKVYYPEAFYAVYFTVRADAFDVALFAGGEKAMVRAIKQFHKAGSALETKDKERMVIMETGLEMLRRGINLLPVNIYKSKATKFLIEDGALRPPFTAVDGVGEAAAKGIENAYNGIEYASVEDFRARTKANSAVVQKFTAAGILDGLPENNQISLF